jgi:hypothetical protein
VSLSDFAKRRRGEEPETYPGADEEREHTPEWAKDDPERFDALDYWRSHLKAAKPGSPQFSKALEEIRRLEADSRQRGLREGSHCPTCGQRVSTVEENEELLAGIVAALDRPEEKHELEHVLAPPYRQEEPPPPAAAERVEEPEPQAPEPSGISPAGQAVMDGSTDRFFEEPVGVSKPPAVERVSVMPEPTGRRSRTGETLSHDAGLARAEEPGHASYAALRAERQS